MNQKHCPARQAASRNSKCDTNLWVNGAEVTHPAHRPVPADIAEYDAVRPDAQTLVGRQITHTYSPSSTHSHRLSPPVHRVQTHSDP